MTGDDYTYLGNFSAVEPQYSRYMVCDDCKVSWTGCWDNFECPKCRGGELPTIPDKDVIDRMAQNAIDTTPQGEIIDFERAYGEQ